MAFLNILANRMVRQAELIAVIIVMTIIFMMILPLPLFLVDMAIALNICIACLLTIQSLFLPNPLAFTTFPTVLLLTTMFRLALTVATSRLILLQHDAGYIVETFGNFVVGGNLAVGMVIFLILTLVNFMVITKGAERVAEVSARFTLDAMPGKQLAIDSDLRAGMIDTAEALLRRNQLAKESQLYGAMDGAMKFVKGDAICSIVIVFINLLGGFSIGILQKKMTAAEAMPVYSVLSIGDGLVAQIPALLISLSAGMVITRVAPNNASSEENIGSEIARQLSRHPKAWLYASVIMALFAVIPGMPAAMFAALSFSCLALAFYLYREARTVLAQHESQLIISDSDGLPEQQNVRKFYPLRAWLIQLHTQQQAASGLKELTARLHAVRNHYVVEYGLMLPDLTMEFSELLPEDEFRFCYYEVPVLRATYDPSRYAVEASLLPAPEGSPGTEEREEQEWRWLAADDPQFLQRELPYITSEELLLRRMKRAMLATGWKFIGLQECSALLAWLKEEQPELAEEFERSLPVTVFTGIVQKLAAEQVTLRPIRLIVETLIANYRHDSDVNSLAEAVRGALKWQICQQYSQNEELHCWLFTQKSEELLRHLLTASQANQPLLSSELSETLMLRLKKLFPVQEEHSAVLLVAADLRNPIAELLRESMNYIPVLSFNELILSIKVHVKGRIALEEDGATEEEAS